MISSLSSDEIGRESLVTASIRDINFLDSVTLKEERGTSIRMLRR